MTEETVKDITAEMRAHARGKADEAFYDMESWKRLCDRIDAAHKSVTDELAKQQAYDSKLEADFSALLKDRNELAEKNRECCEENERLRVAYRGAAKDPRPCQNANVCPCIPDGICDGCEKEKCLKGKQQ